MAAAVNEYLALIQRELGGPKTADRVERGFFTSADYAKTLRISNSTAQRRLQDAVDRKACEVKVFRIETSAGRIFPIRHFRLTPKARK